jgi:hypothetical protein
LSSSGTSTHSLPAIIGTRQTPDFTLTPTLNLGAKVLAAVNGGRISMHGTPVGSRRWSRLAADAPSGASSLAVVDDGLAWGLNQSVLVMSSSFNPWQVGAGPG